MFASLLSATLTPARIVLAPAAIGTLSIVLLTVCQIDTLSPESVAMRYRSGTPFLGA